MKTCYSFQESKQKKATSEPVSPVLEEATSRGRGRDGFVGGGGTYVLPADAASFSSEPPSWHWAVSRAPVSDPVGDSEVTELPVL